MTHAYQFAKLKSANHIKLALTKFWSPQIYQLYSIPDPPCYKNQDMPMMPN